MSFTPFKQFIFPPLQGADGHAFSIRINKGTRGYNGNDNGYTTTEAEKIYLDGALLPLNIGDFERAMHDIQAVPVVPKIEVTLNDVFAFHGYSNDLPVFYDLFSDLSSLLDEIFDDPAIVYELWIDDWLNGVLFEIWFVGDVDVNSLPILHKTIDGEGTAIVHRQQEYTITANFCIERLTADKNFDYTPAGDNVIATPGSIYDLVYAFRIGGNLVIWQGGAAGVTNDPLICGSAPNITTGGTMSFGLTGPPVSGMVVGYIWNDEPNNIFNLSIAALADIIAKYAGLAAGSIDTNMMFDLYAQAFTSGPPSTLILKAGRGGGNWGNIYLNANFLFGNGITVKNSWSGTGISLTGTDSGGVVHLTGTFYDWNPIYFVGTHVGSVIQFVQCQSDYSTPQDSYGGAQLGFSGTVSGSTVKVSGGVAGSSVGMFGTTSGGTIALAGSGPLVFNWPSTIGPAENVITLAAYIAMQTGTWIDSSIDISGNVTMHYRARRTRLPADGGPPLFAFTNLSIDAEPLISGSNQDPSEISQSSVTVQCKGNDLVMMCGPDAGNAVALTMPWQCHKFGAYVSATRSNFDTALMPAFYNPCNDINQCKEQWWDRSKPWGLPQGLCVTTDAKVADVGPDRNGENDYNLSAGARIAIPTSTGWVGSPLLFWRNTGTDIFPNAGGDNSVRNIPSTTGMYAIAAILPAGLPLPSDEMLGGYFDPQTAAAQVYFQELVLANGKKILVQDYIGCRGDDGYIQSLRPGLLFQTFLRGAFRTLKIHNVKQGVTANRCTIHYIEVLDDNNLLPGVAQISGSGAQSSSSSSSSSSPSGGGGSALTLPNWVNLSITSNENNLALSPIATGITYFINVTGNDVLSGIANGASGLQIVLVNVGTGILELSNLDTNSIAQNRFQLTGSIFLSPYMSIALVYNSTLQKWLSV